MDLSDIQGKINPYLELMMDQVKTVDQAEEADSKFLMVRSYLAECQYSVKESVLLLKGLEKATYAKAFAEVGLGDDGKKMAVNAREYEADRDPEYQKVLAEKAKAESLLDWIENHIDIFKDATVSARQKAERHGRNF